MGATYAKSHAAGAPQRSEEDQRLINRAKAILIRRCSLTEAQAHRSLQRLSMETSRPLVDVARQVVELLEDAPHE